MTTTRLRCNCGATAPLKPLALEPGLHAADCAECGAVLLQMSDWRRWRDAQAHTDASPAAVAEPIATETQDHAHARHCPACARLMERLSVDAAGAFRVDRCVPCQCLWLDRGEWQALVQRDLASQLDTLLSDSGQRRLQAERLQATRMQALRQRHGSDRIDELQRIRNWLAEQPHREELLALLRTGDLH